MSAKTAPELMARPKLRLDLSTAEDKENQSVVKDLKRRSSTDVVGVRELQAFQTQVFWLVYIRECNISPASNGNVAQVGSVMASLDVWRVL